MKKPKNSSCFANPVGWLFFAAGLFCWTAPCLAQIQSACTTVVSYAEDEFFHARFESAARALEKCVYADGLSADTLFQMHLLRARVYYAAQNESEAANAVEELLDLRPDYVAESPLPPTFIAFVEYHREIRRNRDTLTEHFDRKSSRPELKSNRRKWLLIGGSVLATGTAMALLSGGNQSPEPRRFPTPPAPPVP